MRVRFVHVSGGRRGAEQVFDQDRVTIGSAPDNDLRFDGTSDPGVAPHHAEARVEGGEVLLADRGSGRGLFVNGEPVRTVALRDGDLVEVGEGGPKLRFHRAPEVASKPLRSLVADAGALVRAARRGRVGSATAFLRYLAIAVGREASPAVRLAFVLGLLLMVLFLVGVPIVLVAGQWQLRQARTVIAGLSVQLRQERLFREGLHQRVEAARRAVEEQQQALTSGLESLRRERDRLRGDLATAEGRLQRLETAQSAGERIIARVAGGVALLQVLVGFEDGEGRRLRYTLGPEGKPLLGPGGDPALTVEGDGPPATRHFVGTGFLVRADGQLLTSRHVVEPWQGAGEVFAPFRTAGFRPVPLLRRAFFPGIPRPFPLTVARVSEEADVAVLKFEPGKARLPVLELDRTGQDAAPGRSVLVIGYPTGLEAILAKAPPNVLDQLVALELSDLVQVVEALATRRLIRPAATRGFLGDVLPHEMTFDAQTTIGGSGGPVVAMTGRVVGVSYAVLRQFGGSNFAVPVRLVLPLLRGS
jgi:S1-C subfamily serine protease